MSQEPRLLEQTLGSAPTKTFRARVLRLASWRIGVIVMFLTIWLSRMAGAQTRPQSPARTYALDIVGMVRDSATGAPVRGAVVTALDSSGALLARNITGERGTYRLASASASASAPSPARAATRVRVLRLGYRPATLLVPAGGDGRITLDVMLTAIPLLIQGMTVTTTADRMAKPAMSPRCPAESDRGAALELLEQVRAGLLSMVTAREANPARVVRLAYTRDLDPAGDAILRQDVRLDSAARAAAAFGASRSPAEFVRVGFRRTEGDDHTMFGPDAEVLLDDDFAAGYCFRLASSPARPGEVGLGFAPATRQRNRIDIDGTLWVDSAARRLVDIEFRYLGLDRIATDLGAGGRISFREMPSGVSFIDRWLLRLVGGRETVSRNRADGSGSVRTFSLIEVGGELARASWPTGERWVAPLATVQLQIVDDSGAPVAGVSTGLLGTDYGGVSDGMGRVTIQNVLPGPYSVFVENERLAPIGVTLPTALHFTARRSSTLVRRLTLPRAETFVATSCGQEHASDTPVSDMPAMLVARAITAPGDSLAVLRWRLRRLDAGGWRTLADVREAGATGLFQRCHGLAAGETVELEVTRAGQTPERVRTRLARGLTVVPVPITSRADVADAKQRVSLTGVVRDSSSGRAVPDIRVAVAGTLRETMTDSAGRFLLAGLLPGDLALDIGSEWLDSIGAVKRVRVSLPQRDDAFVVHAPSVAELAVAACGAGDFFGVIVGRVRLSDGTTRDAPPGFTLVAEWATLATDTNPSTASTGVQSQRTSTMDGGTFKLCGVPLDTPLRLRAEPSGAGEWSVPTAEVYVRTARRFARLDLTLTRRPRNPP